MENSNKKKFSKKKRKKDCDRPSVDSKIRRKTCYLKKSLGKKLILFKWYDI